MRRRAPGKQDEARDLLKAIAAREPGNAPVRVELSRVLAAGGDFDGADRTWQPRRCG